MAYATLSDVAALAPARVFTATSKPASAQVGQFLDWRAGEIDAILTEKGYALPVPYTASSALLFLGGLNALGAWADVENAAEQSATRDQANTMWQSSLAMLKAANQVLDIPKNEQRASPRGPGLTTPPGITDQPYDPYNTCFNSQGQPADNGQPLFTRAMQF